MSHADGTRRDRGEPEGTLRGRGLGLPPARSWTWIDKQRRATSLGRAELIAFAKKMKARQFARMLTFEDEETGRKIKRLWSFPTARPDAELMPTSATCRPRVAATDQEIRLLPGSAHARSVGPCPTIRRPAILRVLRRSNLRSGESDLDSTARTDPDSDGLKKPRPRLDPKVGGRNNQVTGIASPPGQRPAPFRGSPPAMRARPRRHAIVDRHWSPTLGRGSELFGGSVRSRDLDGRPRQALAEALMKKRSATPSSRHGSSTICWLITSADLRGLFLAERLTAAMAGGCLDLPQAGRLKSHRGAQDQQRPRSGHDRPADGVRSGSSPRPGPVSMAWPPPRRVPCFGLECTVYMGEEDIRRQKLNVFNMRTMGASVVAVTSGSRTLRDATNEAMRDWMGSSERDPLHHRQRGWPAPVPDDRSRLPGDHRPRDPEPVPGASRPTARLDRRLRRRRFERGRNVLPVHRRRVGRTGRRRGGGRGAGLRGTTLLASLKAAPACSTAASATSSRTMMARPTMSTRSRPAWTIPASVPSTATGRTPAGSATRA